MAEASLKSYRFRREREAVWQELEGLIAASEKKGVKSLTSAQLLRLPVLYRATLSSLSVARAISLDRNVVRFLESLSARAYFVVYGTRSGVTDGLVRFFTHGFPAAVRAARRPILLSACVMALAGVVGYALTLNGIDWFYTFVSAGIAGDRNPTTPTPVLLEQLYDRADSPGDMLHLFAAFLFSNNARIGMLCFALGFALGIPVLFLLAYNGLSLGAFAALYQTRGLSTDLWGWLSVHGTTELLAVVLCGGAGLMLGGGVAFPGRHSRLDALARNGRVASRVVIGAVAMFFIAALLEGFARQLVTDITTRYLIGGAALVWWAVYFVGARGNRGDGR